MTRQPDKARQPAGYRSDESLSEGRARRLYAKPALVVYGSLRALTRLNGNDDFDGIVGTGDVT